MTPKLSSFLRSGLIALGVAAGVSAPAFAVPFAGLNPAAGQPASQGALDRAEIIRVQEGGGGRFSGCKRDGRCGPRARSWQRGGDHGVSRRHWRGDRGWRGNRGWRGDRGWRDRRHYRRHYRRNHYRQPSIYFDLSLPSYRYVEPRRYYQPRRVYRAHDLSQGHVEWCYSRYRSYRAYDNSFQPYNGPRQQCWSPYS